ncbi:unnamed protein product [Amoebophrya sp. A25]|nr:unnamed protein product [Amoebophrya sp. A25]|eukprot:GSA25T00022307001.1
MASYTISVWDWTPGAYERLWSKLGWLHVAAMCMLPLVLRYLEHGDSTKNATSSLPSTREEHQHQHIPPRSRNQEGASLPSSSPITSPTRHPSSSAVINGGGASSACANLINSCSPIASLERDLQGVGGSVGNDENAGFHLRHPSPPASSEEELLVDKMNTRTDHASSSSTTTLPKLHAHNLDIHNNLDIHGRTSGVLIFATLVNSFFMTVYTIFAPYDSDTYILCSALKAFLAWQASIRFAFITARIPPEYRASGIGMIATIKNVATAVGAWYFSNVLFDSRVPKHTWAAGLMFRVALYFMIISDVFYIYALLKYRKPEDALRIDDVEGGTSSTKSRLVPWCCRCVSTLCQSMSSTFTDFFFEIFWDTGGSPCSRISNIKGGSCRSKTPKSTRRAETVSSFIEHDERQDDFNNSFHNDQQHLSPERESNFSNYQVEHELQSSRYTTRSPSTGDSIFARILSRLSWGRTPKSPTARDFTQVHSHML